MIFKAIKTDHKVLDKIPIIEFLVNNHMNHCQRQGKIRTRPQLKPGVRFFSEQRLDRVHNDQFGPAFELPNGSEMLSDTGFNKIGTPNNDTGRPAFIIGDRIRAAGHLRGKKPR